MKINGADLFKTIKPDFFQEDSIRSLPPENIYVEQVMDLHTYDPEALELTCPAHITFGLYQGDMESLHETIRLVEEDWTADYNEGDSVYCAFDGDKVVSFCLLDDFGEYNGLRLGAPGCVGTIPEYRKQGIGLKMVQKATGMLKDMGYDLGYIHYTSVGHWYARLGYETILHWNAAGIVE